MDNQAAVAPIKNIGIEISEKDIDLVDGNIIGSIAAKHQGQLGFIKIKVEGGFSALPLINKGIDFLEKKIPGNQTVLAATLKGLFANIKL